MTNEQIQQERQAFETWFLSTGKPKFFLQMQITETKYGDTITETAWQAWLAAKQSAWISVKERLPETFEIVIVANEKGMIYSDWRNDYDNWNWSDNQGLNQGLTVTHWQPMPNQPRE